SRSSITPLFPLDPLEPFNAPPACLLKAPPACPLKQLSALDTTPAQPLSNL
ncbi:hypothetical protein HETIRDRAFT_108731, partial [Heterobasidion irregulare TC 32-1]